MVKVWVNAVVVKPYIVRRVPQALLVVTGRGAVILHRTTRCIRAGLLDLAYVVPFTCLGKINCRFIYMDACAASSRLGKEGGLHLTVGTLAALCATSCVPI